MGLIIVDCKVKHVPTHYPIETDLRHRSRPRLFLVPVFGFPLSPSPKSRYIVSYYDIFPEPSPPVLQFPPVGRTRDISKSRRTRMTQQHRPIYRSLLISLSLCAVLVAGCKKKIAPPPPAPPPAPVAVKPTATISADRTSIKKGESVRLTWTTTDATNVSIAPEVGAVTAQGSTTVTPSDSTTYSITATGAGGTASGSVSVTVTVPPPPVVEAPKPTLDELFLKEVRDAYFDYDKADIRADAKEALAKTADFFRNYPQLRVTIEGHCDERGSTEYNLALGDRRASAVKQYLVSLGISACKVTKPAINKIAAATSSRPSNSRPQPHCPQPRPAFALPAKVGPFFVPPSGLSPLRPSFRAESA